MAQMPPEGLESRVLEAIALAVEALPAAKQQGFGRRLAGKSRCQDVHPEFCGEVTWEELAKDIFMVPAICFVVQIPLFWLLHKIWKKNERGAIVKQIVRFVGSIENDSASFPWVVNSIFAVEMVLSLYFAFSWIGRTYWHAVSEADLRSDQMLCFVFCITYVSNALRHQCSMAFLLSPSSLITVFTVTPTFVREETTAAWFSFSYLRIYNAVIAYEKLEKIGALEDVSEIKRGYAITLLRTTVLVVTLSGTVFSLEVLGDPEMFEDKFTSTGMGQISFIQMVYWIFTTISTVGYGDFSPTTTLSRLFIIIAIVVGVYFFSTEINSLAELHKLQNQGKGKFQPSRAGTKHVIVIGGGVRGSSSVLKSFLEELFSYVEPGGHVGIPNLSFMASTEQPAELQEAISSLPKIARLRTNYFMGDPTRYADMERLRMGEAALLFIMTDLHAHDIDQEDTSNILRALAVKQAFPHVNMRLMLQRPASKARAVRVGIWPTRCFSINELKSALFAQSCACTGWSTMITHMLVSETEEEHEENPKNDQEAWMKDFKKGRNFNITGLTLHKNYNGWEWVDFCRTAAKVGVMPLAAQIEGRLVLNPIDYTMKGGEVVFVIAPSQRALRDFDDEFEDWRANVLQSQMDWAQRQQPGAKKPSSFKQLMSKGEPPRMKVPSLAMGPTSSRGMRMPWPGVGNKNSPLPEKPDSARKKAKKEVDVSLAVGETKSLARNLSRGGSVLLGGGPQASKAALAGAEMSLDDSLLELEAQAAKMAQAGGHFIIVVLAGNPWNQMQAFMRILRARHLPFHIPIIILAEHKPSMDALKGIFMQFPRVAVTKLQGPCQVSDLMAAGMMECRCITLFAGNASQAASADKRMVDGAGVTLLAGIESTFLEHQITDPYMFQGRKQCHVILELHRQESVKFMHRFPLFEERFMNGRHGSSTYNPKESLTNHPRFASGGIFTASCLGALVARSYYTPGLVELIEGMVSGPAMDQTSFPWQITIPESLQGKSSTYGDLVQLMLDDSGGVICLGLYRKCFESKGSVAGYVVTNPHPNTELRDDDLVIVLGTQEFGLSALQRGMIPGAIGAPRDYEPEEKLGDHGSEAAGSEALPMESGMLASEAPDMKLEEGVEEQANPLANPDVIPPEEPLPSLPHLHKELADMRRLLHESLGREASLRAQLRACQWPLPADMETPRAPMSVRSPPRPRAARPPPPVDSPEPESNTSLLRPQEKIGGCYAMNSCGPSVEKVVKLSHV